MQMKKMFEDLFSSAFCINLEKRHDRWDRVRGEFEREGLDVEKVYATDGSKLGDDDLGGLIRKIDGKDDGRLTKWEYGCLMSHRRCWERAIMLDLESFFVFEDDVSLVRGFKNRFCRALEGLPETWEIISAGYNSWVEEDVYVGGELYRSVFGLEAHAYGMRTSVAKELLNEMDGKHGQVDVVMGRRHRLGNCYVVRPVLAWQVAGWSDIKQVQKEVVKDGVCHWD